MEAAAHTPGPWRATDAEAPAGVEISILASDDDEPRIASLGVGTRRARDEHRTNARLIAAAPAMLAALEIAVTTLEAAYIADRQNLSAKLAAQGGRAALALARGEVGRP